MTTEDCARQFAGDHPDRVQNRTLCNLLVRQDELTRTVAGMESRASGGDRALQAQLTELSRELGGIQRQIERLRPSDQAAPAVTSVTPTVATAGPTVMHVGQPFQVVQAPGANMAAVYNWGGASLRLADYHRLFDGGYFSNLSSRNIRIVLMKNGSPIAVAHGGAPVRFETFYADTDGDGVVDTTPYNGFNPNSTPHLFVNCSDGDMFETVILVQSDQIVLIPGQAPQRVWNLAGSISYSITSQTPSRLFARNGTMRTR